VIQKCITTTLHSKKEMIEINEQTTTKVEYPFNGTKFFNFVPIFLYLMLDNMN
jgi:hypothetical protein